MLVRAWEATDDEITIISRCDEKECAAADLSRTHYNMYLPTSRIHDCVYLLSCGDS